MSNCDSNCFVEIMNVIMYITIFSETDTPTPEESGDRGTNEGPSDRSDDYVSGSDDYASGSDD